MGRALGLAIITLACWPPDMRKDKLLGTFGLA